MNYRIFFALALLLASISYAHDGTEVIIFPWYDDGSGDLPEIDGKENDWAWYMLQIGSIHFSAIPFWSKDKTDDPSDFSGYMMVAAAWEQLFVFVRIYDDTLRQEVSASEKDLWHQDDHLSLILDMDHSGSSYYDQDLDWWERSVILFFRPMIDPLADWDSVSPFVGNYSDHWLSQNEYTQFASIVDTMEDGRLTYTYEIAVSLTTDGEVPTRTRKRDNTLPIYEEGVTIGMLVLGLDVDSGGDQTVFGIEGSVNEYPYPLNDYVSGYWGVVDYGELPSAGVVEYREFPSASDSVDWDDAAVLPSSWCLVKRSFSNP